MPVVSLDELDELAAGRGVAGLPGLLWAYANAPEGTNIMANAILVSFMVNSPLLAN
jgi:hypothetical protein